MKFSQLTVLLPCRSLEDFPLHRQPHDAEQLLSAWSALYHPALVATAQVLPSWFPAEEPPQDPAGHLVMLPDCSRRLLPEDWLAGAESGGACVVRDLEHRDQMVAAALGHLDPGPQCNDSELVADFLALGFCHFQVELLTRQLRYMSNLDEESFRTRLVPAAEAAVGGDAETARGHLQGAFDLLHEAREYFYPVEARLLDLTLVAPTTLGPSLRAELAGDLPVNLLISGEVIQRMALEEPDTLKMLAKALENNTAGIIGGGFSERELPLLTPEVVRAELLKGLEACEKHLDIRPTVFGRRRFGLSPVLPQILAGLGFDGVIHSTLDDGRFPTGNQSRIQWEGLDGTTVEALARVPLDIRRADAFLCLSEKLGDAMDLDHVATVVLAHWPGQTSRWYRDLRRIAGYSTVMGTFSTVNDYFTETNLSGQQTQYRADQYRAPYLTQSVAADLADPISRWVGYYRRRAGVETLQTLDTLGVLSAGSRSAGDAASAVERLVAEVEDSHSTDPSAAEALDGRIGAELHGAAERFARALADPARSVPRALFVANPCGCSRRLFVAIPRNMELPEVAGAIRATGEAAGEQVAVVDVPAMGFARVEPGKGDATGPTEDVRPTGRRGRRKPKEEPPLAEENVLRNDFFEVTIDPHTGAVRSVCDYHSRGARLSQQIALRMPQDRSTDPGDDLNYSIMAADDVTVTSSGPLLGEIVCRGRLVDREVRRLAGFSQTTRVRRGSRVIEIEIELDVGRVPGSSPWNSYYAARFAWADATANLYRSVGLANVPTDCVQVEAPHFIDVRSGKVRTTLLTGGLPYHRRFGLRKLDTLLVVRGETARRFRLGVGIDLPHPLHGAIDFLAPETSLTGVISPPSPNGWLFHLDCRNVIATCWKPILSDGRAKGFRVRLLETDGRKVQLNLRSFRPVASARKINRDDSPADELPVDDDRMTIEMGAHKWVEVEVRFA